MIFRDLMMEETSEYYVILDKEYATQICSGNSKFKTNEFLLFIHR